MNLLDTYQRLRRTDPRTANALALLVVLGGLVPVSLIVFSTGYAQLLQGHPKGPAMLQAAHAFARLYVWVYAASILLAAWTWNRIRTHNPVLARRAVIGIAAGALATFALDGLRLLGVVKGWLPMDTPVLFGTVLLGPGADPERIYAVGTLYHVLNGASFGLLYAIVWGRQPTTKAALQRAIGLLLVVELGMMTLPPMQPIVGAFGTAHDWPNLFLVTLAAHVAFGAVLAAMTQGLLHGDPGDLAGLSPETAEPEPVPLSPSAAQGEPLHD